MNCPACNGEIKDGKCRLCGAERRVNENTGNIYWMRRGKVIAAFQDEKDQYIAMAKRNGIPEEKWPKRFRS